MFGTAPHSFVPVRTRAFESDALSPRVPGADPPGGGDESVSDVRKV